MGLEMKNALKDLAFKLDFVTTTETHPTGSVSVTFTDREDPQYHIEQDVAWDHITWSDSLELLAKRADAVCFGSLAQRNPDARNTIERFLDCTAPHCLRIFDINLRKPLPEWEILHTSLKKATILKLNVEELQYLSERLSLKGNTADHLAALLRRFDLSAIALTRGGQGSTLITGDEIAECSGYTVDVQDTVGAGDAFTAALVLGYLRKNPTSEVNATACRVAACVCSQAGAMASLPASVLKEFREHAVPVREYNPGDPNRERRRESKTRP